MSEPVRSIPNPVEQPTITVEVVAELLGIGRQAAYRAVRAGQIPSIRVGRLIRVPTAPLLELLGQPAPSLVIGMPMAAVTTT